MGEIISSEGVMIFGMLIGGLVFLALWSLTVVNLSYYAFALLAGTMNFFGGEQRVVFQSQIRSEIEANLTLTYEVSTMREKPPIFYRTRLTIYQIEYEAVNNSRWEIEGMLPVCTLFFQSGNWQRLEWDTNLTRTSLDQHEHISTRLAPAARMRRVIPTKPMTIDLSDGPAVRADCTFDITVPWWDWAVERPQVGGRS